MTPRHRAPKDRKTKLASRKTNNYITPNELDGNEILVEPGGALKGIFPMISGLQRKALVVAVGMTMAVAVGIFWFANNQGGATPDSSASSSPAPFHKPVPSILPDPVEHPGSTFRPSPAIQAQSSDMAQAPTIVAEINTGSGSEPCIAVSPFDSRLVAITHHHVPRTAAAGLTGVRVSRDGGRIFSEVKKQPGAGHVPVFHAQVAWGPGPGTNSSRLWWIDAIMAGADKISTGITYSDDIGATWAPLYIEQRTPPWVGGFPDITVDNNLKSPNFGAVYATYNWLESSKGPGLAILASGDDGKSWLLASVPAVGLPDHPFSWRINYRIKPAPNGSAVVSFYESNLRHWSKDNLFNQEGTNNVGRRGFATSHLHFDRSSKTMTADKPRLAITLQHDPESVIADPQWQTGFDIDSSGRVWMAVSDHHKSGTVYLGCSDDFGSRWDFKMFAIEGQSSYKPSVAVKDGVVFLGFHALDGKGTVGTYFTTSSDHGAHFSKIRPVTNVRWSLSSLAELSNGAGLRERADFGADGLVRYAYGDGRKGNRVVSIFEAIIKIQ